MLNCYPVIKLNTFSHLKDQFQIKIPTSLNMCSVSVLRSRPLFSMLSVLIFTLQHNIHQGLIFASQNKVFLDYLCFKPLLLNNVCNIKVTNIAFQCEYQNRGRRQRTKVEHIFTNYIAVSIISGFPGTNFKIKKD